MRHRIRTVLLIITALAVMLIFTSCNPNLALNQKYAYSSFEMNLGEKLSKNIEDYVDFGELDADEQKFVRENTEILYDEQPVGDNIGAEPGNHTLTINYCGNQYRKYDILITDKEPPVFTKTENLYTFAGIPLDSENISLMFRAKDNSGKCKLKFDKSKVDYNTPGKYKIKATATDPSGNKTEATAAIIVQKPEYGAKGTYVYVSIPKQTLTYFVDSKIVLQTPVVTGNSYGHSTPTGTFRILNKGRNITLKGLESDGKTEYESFVSYWMAFLGSSYGLHDATWRSSFGGTIYQGGGSHGCVNMPWSKAGELYGMISIGTPVLVY